MTQVQCILRPQEVFLPNRYDLPKLKRMLLGVNSPAISGNPQADAYRRLLLPIILIGDSRLGGISSTISAYESLLLRGYQIDAVSMFSDDYHRNHLYLSSYFSDRGIPLFYIQHPPKLTGDSEKDSKATDAYYSSINESTSVSGIPALEKLLDKTHRTRLQNLDSMANRALQHVWWPFVQHGMVKNTSDVTIIDSAQGDFFSVYRNSQTKDQSLLKPEFDGMYSINPSLYYFPVIIQEVLHGGLKHLVIRMEP